MSTTFLEARPLDSDWLGWLKHELAPTRPRKIRTAIIVAGVVFCVIISMTLEVPELAVSAYMVFFMSKASKRLTAITGIGGMPMIDSLRDDPSIRKHYQFWYSAIRAVILVLTPPRSFATILMGSSTRSPTTSALC